MEPTTPPRADASPLNPSSDPALHFAQSPEQAREAIRSLIGDMDRVAESAMNGQGLDPRVVALLEQAPGLIDVDSFKRKLGFALAERAVFIAEDDPEHAARMLGDAVRVLGPKSPSSQSVLSAMNGKDANRVVLGALAYASRRSKKPSKIAEEAKEIIRQINEEHGSDAKHDENKHTHDEFADLDDLAFGHSEVEVASPSEGALAQKIEKTRAAKDDATPVDSSPAAKVHPKI